MARHVVGTAAEIPPGGRKLVTLAGRKIGVFNINGQYSAILNVCPHEGAELCKGLVVGEATSDMPGEYRFEKIGELLKCPWHGWQFDIRTGQSWCDPEKYRVRTYNVSIEPGSKITKGPYVVETFPVAVENDYVVVDL